MSLDTAIEDAARRWSKSSSPDERVRAIVRMLLLYGDKARRYGAPLSDDDTMKLVKDELHRVCTVCRAELAEEARLARIGQRNARVIALLKQMTVANGCTQAEAEAALDKMNKIMQGKE